MIFLAAGTQDAREIALLLLEKGYEVTASVVSEYGKILLQEQKNLTVIEKMLDEKLLRECLQNSKVNIFIDASHPYAVNISKTAMQVCEELGIVYIRYERPITALPQYDKLYKVESFEAAAVKAFELGDNVFLTTGSRHLREFTDCRKENQRLTARVLPALESVQACINEKISLKDIIAMQGPFSHALNKAMYAQTKAQVVVMKNSGKLGGTDTKITAAIEAGLALIVIDRPQIKYKNIFTDKEALLKKIEQSIVD